MAVPKNPKIRETKRTYVETKSPLVALFYDLIVNRMPIGDLEEIIEDQQLGGPWLLEGEAAAKIAKELALKLKSQGNL